MESLPQRALHITRELFPRANLLYGHDGSVVIRKDIPVFRHRVPPKPSNLLQIVLDVVGPRAFHAHLVSNLIHVNVCHR